VLGFDLDGHDQDKTHRILLCGNLPDREEHNMENTAPRLLFPALKPFYDRVEPLSWLLIRVTAGLMLIPHGWPKLMMGITATANMALVKRGIAPAEPLAIILITLETLGGLCIALGLATRFWAAAVTVEMGVIA